MCWVIRVESYSLDTPPGNVRDVVHRYDPQDTWNKKAKTSWETLEQIGPN